MPGLPALELIRTAPHRISVVILIKIIGEAPYVVRQPRVPAAELADGHIFKEILRIIEMARQDINATEHVLIKKIGLLGDKADRIVINQLCIHHGSIVNPDEGSIDQRTFERLDAEEDIFAGQGMAVLKGGIAPDLKSIGELVLRDDGS